MLQREHSAILSTFIKLRSIAEKGAFCNTFDLHKAIFVFKTFDLSIFEWPLETGFTVIIIHTLMLY